MIGSFYAFDIIVLAIVLMSALLAFARGFFREFLAVLSWIAAFFVTLYGFDLLQPTVRGVINIPQVADIVTAVSLFVVSLIVFSLISTLLTSRIKDGKLGPVDRSLGFVFGLARGVFVVSILYLMASFVVKPINYPEWVQKAKMTGIVDHGARVVYRFIPSSWLHQLAEMMKNTDNATIDPLGVRAKSIPTQEIFHKLNQPTTEEEAPVSDKLGEESQQPTSSQSPQPKGYSAEQQQDLNKTIEQLGDQEDNLKSTP